MRTRRNARARATGRVAALALVAAPALALVTGACAGPGGDQDSVGDAGAAGAPPGDVEAESTPDESAGDGAGASTGGSALDLVAARREVVRTGSVRLTVDRTTEAADEVRAIAAAAGGFVADEVVRADEDAVTITVRVPSDRFDEVLAGVGELGDVAEQRVEVTDVTAEVVDLESRIASLRASVARLRGLLAEAGSVEALAVVEGELTRRETELEALLGQQRVLADQVALGTLTVRLSEDPPPAPAEDAPGFTDGLRRGWVAFVDGGRALLAAAGFVLPFAVPVALAAAAVRWWQRRRRAVPAPEPSA
jgi:hypothetical protein